MSAYDAGYFVGWLIIPAILLLAGFLAGKVLTREGERYVQWPFVIALLISLILLLGHFFSDRDPSHEIGATAFEKAKAYG